MEINMQSAGTFMTILGMLSITALVPLVVSSIYKKFTSDDHVKQTACDEKHKALDIMCEKCKAEMRTEICSVRHEITSLKGILLLIAMKVKVPEEDLKKLVG